MKTYIGTTEKDERVFIEWELKDGKFSASGIYLNQAGTDYTTCGQCIDSIVRDFPNSEQAQAIFKVWSEYHLKKEIPENIMKEILSWEEVAAPEQLTPIEKYCQQFDIKIKYSGQCERNNQIMSHYKMYIKGYNTATVVVFDYYQGTGITQAPEPKKIMACVLWDAWAAEQGIEYLVDELGYSGKEAEKVYHECKNTLHKLQIIGAYDYALAETI